MGSMNLAGGYGAGAGADALKDLIKQKFLEQIEARRGQEAQQEMGLRASQQDLQARGMQDVQGRFNTERNDQIEAVKVKGAADALAKQEQAAALQAFLGANPHMAPIAGAKGVGLNYVESPEVQAQRAAAADAKAAGLKQEDRAFTLQRDAAARQHAVRLAGMRQGGGAADGEKTAREQNEVSDSIALLDQIAGDSALDTAVGPLDAYGGKIRDLAGVTRFENLHNQLVGKLQLAQAGKLKGQGQISDKERAMLQQAASALTRNLSEADYKAELLKIRGQFERMQAAPGGAPAKSGGASPSAARAAELLKKYGAK